ncbi:outer membrane beta-barrel protein [Vibrio sp. 10N.261.51.F12]|uniref:outer membrane beta-barrel protein n=1 Tax=Vibrio sp. 10N.261.51.F12 TaxID=3229679 RepID=UPI00355038A4
MKHSSLALICLSLISGVSHAGVISDAFSGITIGGGYATDSSHGETLKGYSVYSQGYIVPSMKENLFTDFRVTTTSNDSYSGYNSQNGTLETQSIDLVRYQAAVGFGVPYHATDSIVVKPYVTAGWSWDKVSAGSQDEKDNSFVASAGVKGEFGEHFMTGVGYSKETNGLKSGQWLVDVGYRFN